MLILLRIGLRYLFQNRIQTILLILGLAVGVSVMVSVDLANESASRSFQISVESIAGRTTHRIIGRPSGMDESIYRFLRVEMGLERVAPVVEDYVTTVELGGRPMKFLGLDPFAEPAFRGYLTNEPSSLPQETLTLLLTRPRSVLISEDLADAFALAAGSKLTLRHGSRNIEVTLAGRLKPRDELSRQALDGLIIADISTAQEVLNQVGQLSHIDLIIDTSTAEGDNTLNRISEVLPPGVSLERPEARAAAIEEINSAFQLNLFALSLLALVVGAFFIYNTITFSVVKRGQTLGRLRALGASRRQIFGMIIFEALILGTLGTLLGLGLGIILGKGLVNLVSQTVNDLYFTLTVTNFNISPQSLMKGVFIGITTPLVAAAVPAWEATRAMPVTVFRRSDIESGLGRAIPKISLAGVTLCLLGFLILLIPSRSIQLSFAGLLSIILGSALLVPITTKGLMSLFNTPIAMLAGVIGLMAPRNIIRSQSRTGVAIAALMVSVSAIVSVDIMIGSFRQTVVEWLEYSLQADIFISTPSTNISSKEGFDASVVNEIRNFPGITEAYTARRVRINTSKYGLVDLVAVNKDISASRRLNWTAGDPKDIWSQLEKGALLVSEPFAYRNRIPEIPGTAIELSTDKGTGSFPLFGIYHDYSSARGIVLMSDSTYRRFWNDTQITTVAANVSREQDLESIISGLRESFAGRHDLIVQSNRALRLSALEIFDRTFTITRTLRLLAAIVAFIGVLSALMALQLERMHEIGVLRANGMTVVQLWRMILLETGLIGFTAGLLALPLGTILALILVEVINTRSFGWTIEFIMRPEYFLWALAIAVSAALSAGLYPAFRFGRAQIASALRME